MLTIRDVQLEALREAARRRLVNGIYACLAVHWADDFLELGPDGARALIEHGFRRATRYGIERDCDIGRYVNLMFFLGDDFDTDPDLPWAAEILGDNSLHARHKLDLLLKEGMRETEREEART